ncbi:telomere repeats-binding bouquet formation protein 1-like [Ochotona curzoniae]|uniref:telomere repeats-binding bouquet formation protein 1 n=1 Tax=Ochotona curzoniae TaxID=130825 RepID=UPI001B34E801|nr:telomere repeats-binding bouquet formation protein 1 [Ochotona curzoniae]XP_040853185.1 telomere repeats-binding bouquet formation protein 1-like [Ochotona curzoniae]
MESEDTKKTQEMKTDVNLLLECIKHQMDNPVSQKEALVTIHSICQQNSNAGVYFREIGGLVFLKNLAKSSEHRVVKEAALYTLGAIAEKNVYCQQTLCTSEFFEDLTWFLSNNDSNTNLKRMSVYVILVLVSNNRTGQTLVRETDCITVLSQLFKKILSKYDLDLSDENVFQSYQLWASVCSTLCVCVNNPQNDENQRFCCSLFSHANDWLMNCMKPEIIRPICSFIGLTLANNTYVQKCFVTVGGLDVLSQVLVQLESDSHKTNSSANLAVVVTKTLDACIADNSTFGAILSKYHIVSKLLALLLHESLDSGEKFSIMLALGHCTEDCEENQYDLLKNNGLPFILQALNESQNEELKRAAAFVLYNCKKITEKLSLSLAEYFDESDTEQLKNTEMKAKNLEPYWKRAKEILQKLEHLERKDNEGKERETCKSIMNTNIENTLKQLHVDSIGERNKAEDKNKRQSRQRQSHVPRGIMSKAHENDDQMKIASKNANPVNACYRESGQNQTLRKTSLSCNQKLPEGTTFEKKNLISLPGDQVFKHPTHIIKNRKQQLPVTDPFTLCSDIINKEVTSFLATDSSCKTLKYRCSGCIAVGKSVNSRNFSNLLHSCPYQCDRHKVIMEAEDRYKNELRKSLICNKKILLTPRRRRQLNIESAPRGIKKRRIRKNFTEEEISYIFSGVKKMGNHWNLILWSFPFQQGRTSVDLAHKYHKLTKAPSV